MNSQAWRSHTNAQFYSRQLNKISTDFHGFSVYAQWPLKLARHDVYNVQCHHTSDYVRHCHQRHPHTHTVTIFCYCMCRCGSWPFKPFSWMHSAHTWRAECFECVTMHRIRQFQSIWIPFVRNIFIIVGALFVSCIVETWNAHRNDSENVFRI